MNIPSANDSPTTWRDFIRSLNRVHPQTVIERVRASHHSCHVPLLLWSYNYLLSQRAEFQMIQETLDKLFVLMSASVQWVEYLKPCIPFIQFQLPIIGIHDANVGHNMAILVAASFQKEQPFNNLLDSLTNNPQLYVLRKTISEDMYDKEFLFGIVLQIVAFPNSPRLDLIGFLLLYNVVCLHPRMIWDVYRVYIKPLWRPTEPNQFLLRSRINNACDNVLDLPMSEKVITLSCQLLVTICKILSDAEQTHLLTELPGVSKIMALVLRHQFLGFGELPNSTKEELAVLTSTILLDSTNLFIVESCHPDVIIPLIVSMAELPNYANRTDLNIEKVVQKLCQFNNYFGDEKVLTQFLNGLFSVPCVHHVPDCTCKPICSLLKVPSIQILISAMINADHFSNWASKNQSLFSMDSTFASLLREKVENLFKEYMYELFNDFTVLCADPMEQTFIQVQVTRIIASIFVPSTIEGLSTVDPIFENVSYIRSAVDMKLLEESLELLRRYIHDWTTKEIPDCSAILELACSSTVFFPTLQIIAKQLDAIHSGKYRTLTMEQLHVVRDSNIPHIVSMINRACNLSIEWEIDISAGERWICALKELKTQVRTKTKIVQWLDHAKTAFPCKDFAQEPSTIESCENFAQKYEICFGEVFQLNEKEKKSFHLFMENDSIIFRDLAATVLQDSGLRGAINTTMEFIQHIHKLQEKSFDDLKHLKPMFDKICNNIDNEILVIQSELSKNEQTNFLESVKTKSIIKETLENLSTFLIIQDMLPCIKRCNCCTSQSIQELENILANQNTGSFQKKVSALREFTILTAKEFEYFKSVDERREIFRQPYFAWNDSFFAEQMKIARGNLSSEHSYGISVLESLETAYFISRPIIDYLGDSAQFTDLGRLCSVIHKTLATGSGSIDSKLKSFDIVMEKMGEIAAWLNLNSTESVLQLVKIIQTKGFFQSRLALHPQGKALLFFLETEVGDQLYDFEDLQDKIRGIEVFQKKGAPEIVKVISIAKSIHKMHLELESIGHPDFQGSSFRLNEPGKFSEEGFNATKLEIQQKKEEWEDYLRRLSKEFPRLLFLDFSLLSKCIASVDYFLQQKRRELLELVPFMWVCFPAQSHEDIVNFLTDKALHIKPKQDGSMINSPLGIFGAMTKDAEQAFRIYIDEEYLEQSLGIYIFPSEWGQQGSNWQISQLLLSDEESFSLPHPSNVFDCASQSVTSQNLQRFLARVEEFPDAKYYLIHAEEMNLEIRELILKWLNKIIEDERKISFFLIFSRQTGAERFLFLGLRSWEVYTSEKVVSLFRNSCKPNGFSVHCYTSPFGTGKSTAIADELKNCDYPLRIDICEDFKAEAVINALRTKALKFPTRRFGIHFNISAYAPMDRLNSFFERLLVWGYLWEESGDVLYVGNLAIQFFVELHTAPIDDKLYFEKNGSIENIFGSIPTLQVLSTIQTVTHAWKLSDDSNYIARFVHAFDTKILHRPLRDGAIICANLAVMKAGQIEEATVYGAYEMVRACLEDMGLELSRDYPVVNVFTKLFALRLRWLESLCKEMVNTLRSGSADKECLDCSIATLYTLLLRESFFLSSSDITKGEPVHFVSVIRAHSTCSFRFACFSSDKNDLYQLPFNPPDNCVYRDDMTEEVLCKMIAIVLGIPNASTVLALLREREYVLTPDFTFKILFIYERMIIGENVMLTGATGVGKTELVSFFAALLQSRYPFDGLYIVREILQKNFNVTELLETKEDLLQEVERQFNKSNWQALSIIMSDLVLAFQKNPLLAIKKTTYDKLVDLSTKGKLVSRYTVTRQNNELLHIVDDVCSASQVDLFYGIRMHGSYTDALLDVDMQTILAKSKLVCTLHSKQNLVVFIDEINTTSIMGILQSIIVDKFYRGNALPENIHWISAINPYISNAANTKEFDLLHNFSGVKKDMLEYSVRPIPASLQALSVEFRAMNAAQERVFICSLLNAKKVGCNSAQRACLVDCILTSQAFVQKLQKRRVATSIRDILRTVKVYSFLLKYPQLLTSAPLYSKTAENDLHWRALILAVGMCYYLRLSPKDRACYSKEISALISRLSANKEDQCPPDFYTNHSSFYMTMKASMEHLFRNTDIPVGIAPTDSLLENLWCVVICCCATIPLIIVGPPGCSKTLSFSIALDNLKRTSKKKFYKAFCQLEVYRYQCTPQSTDKEIEDRYQNAIRKQELFNRDQDNSLSFQTRCVVFLDEAGLSEDLPLKALHYYMDNPQVSTVILSNVSLDAAKMNRALQVLQCPSSSDDLRRLTAGSLFPNKKGSFSQEETTLIEHFCKAYSKTLQRSKDWSDNGLPFFQIRDYILFLRFLCNPEFRLRRETLLKALERNFNGLERSKFREIVVLWFNEINVALATVQLPLLAPPSENEFSTTKELLQENLDHRLSIHENPNVAPYRYMMLIDPTDSQTAISLLYSSGLCCHATQQFISALPESSRVLTSKLMAEHENQSMDQAQPNRIKVKEVEAMYAFHCSQEHVLSFQPGDIITVRNQYVKLDEWWEGELNGSIGIFPTTFTKVRKICGAYDRYQIPCISDSADDSVPDPPDVPPSDIIRKHCREWYQPNEAIQISIGEFVKDQNDESHTQVVRQIVRAMREGRTVILINSAVISGSFYDLYNRYFKLIESSQERLETYTNIAIGKQSQECFVHPDFKVIIHIPESALPETPLPLLNRFEKYRLSLDDLLQDQAKTRMWDHYLCMDKTKNEQRLSIIDVVKEANLHFLHQFMEPNEKRSLLFFGVDEETVYSLILEAMDNTDPSDTYPDAPMPLGNDSPLQCCVDLSLKNRVLSVIRTINHRLLQLARPEFLYFEEKLRGRKSYVEQYITIQEHYSVLRLMQMVIQKHVENREYAEQKAQKFCVYTRSCGEYHKFRHKLAHSAVKLLGTEKFNDLFHFALEDITSGQELQHRVENILYSACELLLVTADMSECSIGQVNALRQYIDRYIHKDQVVFVVMLYSPTHMLTCSPYPVIFTNHWDYFYCDSFGLSIANEDEDIIQDVDGRAWIAAAFGLPYDPKLQDASYFHQMFFNILENALNSATVSFENREEAKNLEIYSANKNVRTKAVVKLFKENSFLWEAFLVLFSNTWSAAFFNQVVGMACRDIMTGSITSSLMERISLGLVSLLKDQTQDFLKHYYSNFQLVHLARASDGARLPCLQQIYLYSMTLISLRSAQEFIEQCCLVPSLRMGCKSTISCVPMFFTIHKFMQDSLHKVAFECELTPPQLCSRYSKYFQHHKGALDIANVIQANYLEDYAKDLINMELSLTKSSADCLLRNILASLLIDVSTNLHAQAGKLLRIYVTLHVLPHMLSYCHSFFSPILIPFPQEMYDILHKDKVSVNFIDWEVVGMQSNFIEYSMVYTATTMLWKIFSGFLEEKEIPQRSHICAWAKSLRIFHYRTENTLNNLSRLQEASSHDPEKNNYTAQYLMMITSFLIMREYAIAPEEMISLLRVPNISTLLKRATNESPSEIHQCFNLFENLLRCGLEPPLEYNSNPAKRLLSDLCLAVTRGRDKNTYWHEIKLSLQTVLSIAHSPLEFPVVYEHWNAYVDFEWLVNFILLWTEPAQCEQAQSRQNDLFLFCNDLILQRFRQPADYVFQYHLLADPKNAPKQQFPILEYMIFFILVEQIKTDGALATFEALREKYNLLEQEKERYAVTTCFLEQCALVTAMIQRVYSIETLDTLTAQDLQFLRGILSGSIHAPQQPVEFFLQQFTTKDLAQLLGVHEYRADKLQLPPHWHQSFEAISDNYTLFPFMIDEDALYGREYHQMKALVLAEEWNQLTDFINNNTPRLVYQLRMFLILIAYYEFFHKNQATGFLQRFLDQRDMKKALRITGKEMAAYSFLTSKPKQGQTPEMFSAEVRERGKNFDFVDAHFLVNLLATVMGCQPKRTHFYSIVFELESLNRRKMPGSAYNSEFWDCGYKLDGMKLSNEPQIMNDHKRFRLLMNSYVWAPIVWNSILFPRQYVNNCEAVYHLMNYIDDEGWRGQSDFVRYQEYAISRAFTFLHLFALDADAMERKQDWRLFVVSSLFDYAQAQWKPHPDPALVSEFMNSDTIRPYEAFMLHLFMNTDQNYKTIQKHYQKVVLPNTPLHRIDLIQQDQASYYASPFINVQQFVTYRTNTKGPLPSLAVFDKMQILAPQVELLKIVPSLVNDYLVLNQILWRKVKDEDLHSPFDKVLDSLVEDRKISAERRKDAMKIFEEFMKRYNDLAENIEKVQFECGQQKLPLVNWELSFPSTILSTENKGDVDTIYKVIKHLLEEVQAKILDCLSDLDSDEEMEANPFEGELAFYFDTDCKDTQGHMTSLTFQKKDYLSLIATNETFSTSLENIIKRNRVAGHRLPNSHFVCRKSTGFDLPRIEQECKLLLSGIPTFIVERIRRVLETRKDDSTAPLEDAISAALNQSGSLQMAPLLFELRNQSRENFDEGLEERHIDLKPSVFTEKKLISLCGVLTNLLQQMKDPEKREKFLSRKGDSLREMAVSAGQRLPTAFVALYKPVKATQIFAFAELVVSIYSQRPWVFPKELLTLQKALNEVQKAELNKAREFIFSLDHKHLCASLSAIRSFLTQLTDKNSNVRKLIHQFVEDNISLQRLFTRDENVFLPLVEELSKQFSFLRIEDMTDDSGTLPGDLFLQRILPETILLHNFSCYLHWLQSLSGELVVQCKSQTAKHFGIKKQSFSTLSREKHVEYYKEKLPVSMNQQPICVHVEDDFLIPPAVEPTKEKEENENLFHVAPLALESDSFPMRGIMNHGNNGWLSSLLQCLATDTLFLKTLGNICQSNVSAKFSHLFLRILQLISCNETDAVNTNNIQITSLLKYKIPLMNNQTLKEIAKENPRLLFVELFNIMKEELHGVYAILLQKLFVLEFVIQCEHCNYAHTEEVVLTYPECASSASSASSHHIKQLLDDYFLMKHEQCPSCATSGKISRKLRVPKNKESFVFPMAVSVKGLYVPHVDSIDMSNYLLLPEAFAGKSLTANLFASIQSVKTKFFSHYFANVRYGNEWFTVNDTTIQAAIHDSASHDFVILFWRVSISDTPSRKRSSGNGNLPPTKRPCNDPNKLASKPEASLSEGILQPSFSTFFTPPVNYSSSSTVGSMPHVAPQMRPFQPSYTPAPMHPPSERQQDSNSLRMPPQQYYPASNNYSAQFGSSSQLVQGNQLNQAPLSNQSPAPTFIHSLPATSHENYRTPYTGANFEAQQSPMQYPAYGNTPFSPYSNNSSFTVPQFGSNMTSNSPAEETQCLVCNALYTGDYCPLCD